MTQKQYPEILWLMALLATNLLWLLLMMLVNYEFY